MKAALFALLVASLAPTIALADSQPEGVDWQRRVIRATGQAAPDQNAPNIAAARLGAERAAKMDAMRNIIETLKGVQVTGARTGADALTDPGVSSKVAGLIRGFNVVDTRYFSDGGVEVDVEMPLDGLVDTLVPRAARADGSASQTVKAASAQGSEAGATVSAKEAAANGGVARKDGKSAAAGMGLVVDVRGIDFVPALAPRILDENGTEIYGPSVADPQRATRGLAAYATDLDAARQDPRVGEAALVVQAVAIAANRSEVVLSKDDALKARELSLDSGNVVFVTR